MPRAEVEQLDDRGMAAWDQRDTAAFAGLLADYMNTGPLCMANRKIPAWNVS